MFDIGSSLREARTRQGFDFDEMERRTKVRSKYLRFLEEERFEQLPGHTYTKGFLRVYADALGLDGGLYVDEYNSRYVGIDDELQPRLPRGRPVEGRRRRQRGESRAVVLAVAAIAVVTAVVLAAWRFGGSEAPRVVGVNAGQPAPSAASSPQRVTVVITAVTGPSFMEVRAGSRDGDPLYTGTLERGQSQRFNRKGLYLAVARPANVVVKVDGERVPLASDGQLTVAAATGVR